MLDVRITESPASPASPAPTGTTDAPRALVLDLPETVTDVRTAAGEFARELPPGSSVVDVPDLSGARLTAAVEGLVLGTYRFTRAGAPAPAPTDVELRGATDSAALERGLSTAAATCWARDLANTPAGTETPAWLAAQAAAVLTPLGVDVVERDEVWLAEQGFGGVLAVGAGSASPPRLIEASWRPKGARQGIHLVLVGKGITFDTGGVNRKVGTGMRTMHTDMSGAAAVLATMRLIAHRALPVRVTALVPAAENALSGSSFRPGDVLRHHGGRTSEIGNTDAEGRLVLADALAYAAAELEPTALVDVATLTGAMKIALGLRIGGLMGTSDRLAQGLLEAGEASGEPLWRLPLLPEYEGTLRSEIADATNHPGSPGGITAALFLKPFAGGVPWAHLDIAGPARAPRTDGVLTEGATGFGARLLSTWVESLA